MLKELTPEMREAIPAWRKYWIDFALKNNETDKETFTENIHKLYNILGFERVPVFWVQNPVKLQQVNSIGLEILEQKLDKGEKISIESIIAEARLAPAKKVRWHDWFGGHLWLSFQAWYEYYRKICKVHFSDEIEKKMDIYTALQKSVGYWICNKHWVIACEKIKEIHKNENNKLHNEKGKAVLYPDGWGLYYLNGIKVTKEIVETLAEKN